MERSNEKVIDLSDAKAKNQLTVLASRLLRDYQAVNGSSALDEIKQVARQIKQAQDLVNYHFTYTHQLVNECTGCRIYDTKSVYCTITIEAYHKASYDEKKPYYIHYEFKYEELYHKVINGREYTSDSYGGILAIGYELKGKFRYLCSLPPFQKIDGARTQEIYATGSGYAGEFTTDTELDEKTQQRLKCVLDKDYVWQRQIYIKTEEF